MNNVKVDAYPSDVSVGHQDSPRRLAYTSFRQGLTTIALRDQSQNCVDWDGTNDSEKPTILTRTGRWIITMATLTITLTFASTAFSVAIVVAARLFHVGLETMVLGICVGPMIWGQDHCSSSSFIILLLTSNSASRPFSELYGPKISILTSVFLFAIFYTPVAVAKSVHSDIFSALLQGFAGSPDSATKHSFREVLSLSSKLLEALKSCTGLRFSYCNSSTPPRPFQTKKSDLLVQRFIFGLHQLFDIQTMANPS